MPPAARVSSTSRSRRSCSALCIQQSLLPPEQRRFGEPGRLRERLRRHSVPPPDPPDVVRRQNAEVGADGVVLDGLGLFVEELQAACRADVDRHLDRELDSGVPDAVDELVGGRG